MTKVQDALLQGLSKRYKREFKLADLTPVNVPRTVHWHSGRRMTKIEETLRYMTSGGFGFYVGRCSCGLTMYCKICHDLSTKEAVRLEMGLVEVREEGLG